MKNISPNISILILCAALLFNGLAVRDLQKNQQELVKAYTGISDIQTIVIDVLDILATNSCDLPQDNYETSNQQK